MKPPKPNLRLRATRERAGISRGTLAEAVALWLAERDPKGRDVAFDAIHLGKIERGVIERPRALRRRIVRGPAINRGRSRI